MSKRTEQIKVITWLIVSISMLIWILPNVSHATDVQFIWKSEAETELGKQKEFIEAKGGTITTFAKEPKGSGIGPTGVALIILAGSASVCVLAESIVRVVREFNSSHSGIEIERKKDKLVIQDRFDLKSREIEVRSKDGVSIIVKDDNEALCKALISTLSFKSH
jgi:hypothetical protein